MKLCNFCNHSNLVLDASDLRNPTMDCPGCGATVRLPEKRYRIDWSTKASAEDGRPWFQNIGARDVAMSVAKENLIEDLDRAVITDRWDIEKPIILIKNENAQV